jgi:PPP family 3-phenylpropionic acid transporter
MDRLLLTVRKPLSIVRIFFFLWFAGGSFLQPYIPIFYRDQGLSGFQIGLLSSIGFAVGILSAPQWGRWNDRLSAPQRLLQIAVLFNVVTILILSKQTAFLPLIVIVALNSLFASGQEPVAASLAMRATRGTGSGFGSVRVWGSFGWALLVLVAGWWIQRTTIQTAFTGFTVLMLAALLVLFLYHPGALAQSPVRSQEQPVPAPPRGPVVPEPIALPTVPPGRPDSQGASGRYRPILALFLAVMMSWIAVAGIRQFETLYFKQLGAGEGLIGLSAMLSAIVELPSMVWADWLTRRFGARRVLIAGMFLDGTLRGSILLWPVIPALIAVRTLIGVSFSMTTVGVVAYVQERTPHDQQTRAVALYTVVIRNLVFLISYPVVGIIFDTVGAYWLYAVALVGNFSGAMILLFARSLKPTEPQHLPVTRGN